jgi:hypothetical protein
LATNDVYELTDIQTYAGQEVVNVYFYKQLSGSFVDTFNPTPAGTLIDRFIALALPQIAAIQTANLQHIEIKCRNLFDDADASDKGVSVPGTYGATSLDVLPIFNAHAFQLSGVGSVVKDGAKRIAGVVETGQTNGLVTDATLVARMTTAASAILRTLTVGADIPTNNVFQAVLVKRVRSGSAGAYVYRLPENTGESVLANLVSVVFKLLISSQVSRKVAS